MEYVGLADALAVVREELGAAQDAARAEQLRFRVTEVEMEFAVELRSEGGGDGKVTLGVLTLGGAAKASRGDVHRLKVKMEVTDAATGNGPVDVGRDETRPWEK
jgi:NTP-dependent ternary system trypsin peptidase co-occuring protein